MAGNAGGGFEPVDLSSCVLWLRADRGVTIATGVSSWIDQSGAGNTFTQATGASQPALTAAGGPNGRPCLTFNGTSSVMTSAASVTSVVQNWTQFAVVKIANTTQVNNYIFSTGLSNGWGFGIAATGLRGVFWTGTGSGTFGSNTTAWEAWSSWDTSGTNNTVHVNGSSQATSNNISPVASSGGSSLGAFNAGASNWAAFSLWELIVYSRTLSTTEIASVEQYIRSWTAIW